MGMLRPWHIIVLVVVILLLFGARRLPDLARSVGQSLKIFKNEVKDLKDDGKTDESNGQATTPPTATTPPATPLGTTPADQGQTAPRSPDTDTPRA